jgi:D-alanine-D-alanine ligase
MKTLILYTLPPEEARVGHDIGEFDLTEAAQEVLRALPGADIAGVRGSAPEVLETLNSRRPEVVFNLCEAPLGRPDLEAHIAGLLEWQGVRFTGSGSETLALCRRKDWTKAILGAASVPVPREGVLPAIVKPADEDGSTEIYHESVCSNEKEVAKAVDRIVGPAIVEEFLPGKEFVISLWGQTEPDYHWIGEVFFQNGLNLFTYAAKWDLESDDYQNSRLHYNTQIESELRDALITTARAAWRAVGARGYLRMDVRLDEAGLPRVLDVNPNPEMSPDVGMHRAVTEAGWSWDHFIQQQVEWAQAPCQSAETICH